MVYSRQLSSTERAYVVYNECCPPFLNQLFWEGTGHFDLPKWREAVKIASEANPGSRVVVKGVVSFARLVDTGKTPPVIEVDGSHWDGLGPEGAPAKLSETMNPFEGPTSEVVLIHGNPLRIVFRTMHATMDGRGTVTWVIWSSSRCNRSAVASTASRLPPYLRLRLWNSSNRSSTDRKTHV